jgi:uncharacterized damage-inducible protein DinB
LQLGDSCGPQREFLSARAEATFLVYHAEGAFGMDPSSTNQQPRKDPGAELPEIEAKPEPWLRGTLEHEPAVVRGVLHALELAKEDVARWCGMLTVEQLEARPMGLASVAFHVRHIARSLDRLLTYAEGRTLSAEQMAELRTEMEPGRGREELFEEFEGALAKSAARVRALGLVDLEQGRLVGRKKMPSSAGGLLVHVAEHTQRHVGQAITTAKIVSAA